MHTNTWTNSFQTWYSERHHYILQFDISLSSFEVKGSQESWGLRNHYVVKLYEETITFAVVDMKGR